MLPAARVACEPARRVSLLCRDRAPRIRSRTRPSRSSRRAASSPAQAEDAPLPRVAPATWRAERSHTHTRRTHPWHKHACVSTGTAADTSGKFYWTTTAASGRCDRTPGSRPTSCCWLSVATAGCGPWPRRRSRRWSGFGPLRASAGATAGRGQRGTSAVGCQSPIRASAGAIWQVICLFVCLRVTPSPGADVADLPPTLLEGPRAHDRRRLRKKSTILQSTRPQQGSTSSVPLFASTAPLLALNSTHIRINSTAEKSDDDAAPSDGHEDSNFSACVGARVCCWCRWPCTGAARAPACAGPVKVQMPLQTVLIARMTAPIVRITVPIVRIWAGFELGPACAEKACACVCASVAERIPRASAVARRSLSSPPPAGKQTPA